MERLARQVMRQADEYWQFVVDLCIGDLIVDGAEPAFVNC